jgi:prepilin signal peptidase PulO-like enzyme (type II secretory pathway)
VARSRIVQVIAFAGLVAALGYLVVWSADSWADWVVLGVIVLTAFGAALAVHHRDHPTGPKSFTRSSETRR